MRNNGGARRLTAALVAIAGLIAACGDDDTATSDQVSTTASASSSTGGTAGAEPEETSTSATDGAPSVVVGEAPEVTELRVGALPSTHFAPLYYAVEQGFFEDEGLNVTLEPVQGGAVAVQLLTSDELQFSVTNYFGFTQAVSNGAPLRLVAAGTSFSDGEAFIFTKPDSPVQTMADLDGKTLATNTLNSPGDILPKAIAADQGLDITMQFVEVGFGETVAAVQTGAVDAAFTAEPFTSMAMAAGLRPILDISTGATKNIPVAGYMASDEFVESNPNTVAAFARAIEAASAELAGDEAITREFLQSYTELPPQAAESLVLPIYETSLEPAEPQRVADIMAELGLVDEPVDFAERMSGEG